MNGETSQIDPETRAALLKARELIRQREGRKAALVLHTIDHPIARKWERQINQAVDWSRQPKDEQPHQERGPMPLILRAGVVACVLWSALFLYLGVGARLDIFVIICFVILVSSRLEF